MLDPITRFVKTVQDHQPGLLLDTNVLLLHLASITDPAFVSTWKLTRQFGEGHVALLRIAVATARRIVTTPHILTQATDLADQGVSGAIREKLLANLREHAMRTRERYVEAQLVAKDPEFSRLGLADLAQALIRKRSRPLIVTTDANLVIELEKRNLPVQNLNHLVFSS